MLAFRYSREAMPKPDPLSPRKTPRQARSAALVDAMLEAAARILEERGLAACNTNAVAERAGASIGSLYQYFPGRDALIAALIRRENQALHDAVLAAAARARGRSLAADIKPLVSAAVGQQLGRERLARLLDAEEQRLPPDATATALTRGMAAAVITVFQLHRAAIAPRDHAQAAADCIAMARGIIDGAAAQSPRAALEARVLRAVLGYLTFRARA